MILLFTGLILCFLLLVIYTIPYSWVPPLILAFLVSGYGYLWYATITMHKNGGTDAQDNVQNKNMAHR